MSGNFDPYHKWLGIRDPERPPNHYRLLGLELFEDDSETIGHAADRQLAYVRTLAEGQHIDLSQRILNELAAAKVCLVRPQKKADYDQALRLKLAAANPPPAQPTAPVTLTLPQQVLAPSNLPAHAEAIPSYDPPPMMHGSPSSSEQSQAPEKAPPQAQHQRSLRHLPIVVGFTVLVLAVMCGLIWSWLHRLDEQRETAARIAEQPSTEAAPPQASPAVPEAAETAVTAPRQEIESPPPEVKPSIEPPLAPPQATVAVNLPPLLPPAKPAPVAPAEQPVMPEKPPPVVAAPLAIKLVDTAPEFAKAPFEAQQARGQQEAWAKLVGTEVEITNSVGMKLSLIPPGEFPMGSPASDSGANISEKPQHQALITSPFYMGRTEVTREQWKQVMGTEPWKGKSQAPKGPDGPANFVSWDDAVAFCAKLTRTERMAGRIAANESYTLPTEAQWEYACRAGTTTRYSFGDDHQELDVYGWSNENSGGLVRSVGLKQPNAFGLYDMHGNVSEWCQDWYDGHWYSQSRKNDPRGPSSASHRAVRGGSLLHTPLDTRSAFRVGHTPSTRQRGVGFRVARTLQVQPTKDHQEVWAKHLGKNVEMPNSVGMTMVLIPPGEFLMGSPNADLDAGADEKPQHQVFITNPFYMGRTEVTQQQWRQVMGTEPWKGESKAPGGPDYPVTYVSWEDAMAFCYSLTVIERAAGRITATESYTLPTEAQWEYTCRAGTTTRFSFGNDMSEFPRYGWSDRRTIGPAVSVGLKQPNAFGLYDMHGNVSEWCQDWYDAQWYSQSPSDDPQGPSAGSSRVVRGGSWYGTSLASRSASRYSYAPLNRYILYGFRVAQVLGSGK